MIFRVNSLIYYITLDARYLNILYIISAVNIVFSSIDLFIPLSLRIARRWVINNPYFDYSDRSLNARSFYIIQCPSINSRLANVLWSLFSLFGFLEFQYIPPLFSRFNNTMFIRNPGIKATSLSSISSILYGVLMVTSHIP